MSILQDLIFDEGVEQFFRCNKMSSLPMITRNTLIEEVFSKKKKRINRFFREISSKPRIGILLTLFSLFENFVENWIID